MKEFKGVPINLTFFGDDGVSGNSDAAGQEPTGTGAGEPILQEPLPTSIEDLLKSNREFKSDYDRRMTAAVNNAIKRDRETQRKISDRINNDRLTEEEKLAGMSPEGKADYYKSKAEKLVAAREHDKTAAKRKSDATERFEAGKIPLALMAMIDFNNPDVTDADIDDRIAMLSEHDYLPKGKLNELIEAAKKEAVAEMLKQKDPEQRPGKPQGNTKIPSIF